jgi:hypothetical protein
MKSNQDDDDDDDKEEQINVSAAVHTEDKIIENETILTKRKISKQLYDKERMAKKRAEAVHSIDSFKKPHNKKNKRQVSDQYTANIGDVDWTEKSNDEIELSELVRQRLVMGDLNTRNTWSGSFYETPLFGISRKDDEEILNNYLTVHSATAMVSNINWVFSQVTALKDEVSVMKEESLQQNKMLQQYDDRLRFVERKLASLSKKKK